ncbi:unnamed protein product [Calicophoron daubneyi]|uniref:Uncharacterized protein n=1 Tax=Calicophoron daubneyi TaxID=300641 RepID=A0AAV2U281_CALDB
MASGGYHHAIVLSPGTYARFLYQENIASDPNYWRHEDAARHLATQLMSKYSDLTLITLPSSRVLPDSVWSNPDQLSACIFSQASRIILFVPSDADEHIRTFTRSHLVPLLTKDRENGGRPDWRDRFLVAAVGNVQLPTQLGPTVPFLKSVRFREIGWVRDITALMLLRGIIKTLWTPSPAQAAGTVQGESQSRNYSTNEQIGCSLNEVIETTSCVGTTTYVTGRMEVSNDEQYKSLSNRRASSAHRVRGKIRGSKSASRSRSRKSSGSGRRGLEPDFEARQTEEMLVDIRMIHTSKSAAPIILLDIPSASDLTEISDLVNGSAEESRAKTANDGDIDLKNGISELESGKSKVSAPCHVAESVNNSQMVSTPRSSPTYSGGIGNTEVEAKVGPTIDGDTNSESGRADVYRPGLPKQNVQSISTPEDSWNEGTEKASSNLFFLTETLGKSKGSSSFLADRTSPKNMHRQSDKNAAQSVLPQASCAQQSAATSPTAATTLRWSSTETDVTQNSTAKHSAEDEPRAKTPEDSTRGTVSSSLVPSTGWSSPCPSGVLIDNQTEHYEPKEFEQFLKDTARSPHEPTANIAKSMLQERGIIFQPELQSESLSARRISSRLEARRARWADRTRKINDDLIASLMGAATLPNKRALSPKKSDPCSPTIRNSHDVPTVQAERPTTESDKTSVQAVDAVQKPRFGPRLPLRVILPQHFEGKVTVFETKVDYQTAKVVQVPVKTYDYATDSSITSKLEIKVMDIPLTPPDSENHPEFSSAETSDAKSEAANPTKSSSMPPVIDNASENFSPEAFFKLLHESRQSPLESTATKTAQVELDAMEKSYTSLVTSESNRIEKNDRTIYAIPSFPSDIPYIDSERSVTEQSAKTISSEGSSTTISVERTSASLKKLGDRKIISKQSELSYSKRSTDSLVSSSEPCGQRDTNVRSNENIASSEPLKDTKPSTGEEQASKVSESSQLKSSGTSFYASAVSEATERLRESSVTKISPPPPPPPPPPVPKKPKINLNKTNFGIGFKIPILVQAKPASSHSEELERTTERASSPIPETSVRLPTNTTKTSYLTRTVSEKHLISEIHTKRKIFLPSGSQLTEPDSSFSLSGSVGAKLTDNKTAPETTSLNYPACPHPRPVLTRSAPDIAAAERMNTLHPPGTVYQSKISGRTFYVSQSPSSSSLGLKTDGDRPESHSSDRARIVNIYYPEVHGKMCADAATQIHAPLSSGYMRGQDTQCYAHTSINIRNMPTRLDIQPRNTREVAEWTGPDAAELYRLEKLYSTRKAKSMVDVHCARNLSDSTETAFPDEPRAQSVDQLVHRIPVICETPKITNGTNSSTSLYASADPDKGEGTTTPKTEEEEHSIPASGQETVLEEEHKLTRSPTSSSMEI